MAAYYNEHDRFAAAWIRELIKEGLIADGEVDERDIQAVDATDVRGFSQCHFFAGIGGWSYALRLAGWPDDRPVWTGSCPCQPFSSAGKGDGADDPRDLWPAWFQLIRECRPYVCFGEQVESAVRYGWLDRVCDDLESEGYAIGSICLPAASIGAFHVRQRLWFVADTTGIRQHWLSAYRGSDSSQEDQGRVLQPAGSSDAGDVVYSDGQRRTGQQVLLWSEETGRHSVDIPQIARSSETDLLADADCERENQERRLSERQKPTISTRSFWDDAEWIDCRDGKARPIEPGTFPLAHGVPASMGRLRGYGNAIVPQVAAQVIGAYMDIVPFRSVK